jgi:hypothetical protein
MALNPPEKIFTRFCKFYVFFPDPPFRFLDFLLFFSIIKKMRCARIFAHFTHYSRLPKRDPK